MSVTPRIDGDIQTAVQDELEWVPEVDADGIGVAVEDGAVSLFGEVDSYAERVAAAKAALRVRGVNAVVNNLSVHPKSSSPVTETDVAKEVKRALRSASAVPDTVKAEIQGHHLTLSGEVEWDYQRQAAKRAVRQLRGVYLVDNEVTLKERPSADDTEQRITEAITRNAQLDAKAIHVSVDGTTVTLTGTVHSWAERQQANSAAWASPHVMDVTNQLVVTPW